jgi:hypothetical protein
MGQFSVEKPGLPGSVLSGNQQIAARNANVGQLFRPDYPHLHGECDRAFSERRLRTAGQPNSLGAVAISLANLEGGLWRSFGGESATQSSQFRSARGATFERNCELHSFRSMLSSGRHKRLEKLEGRTSDCDFVCFRLGPGCHATEQRRARRQGVGQASFKVTATSAPRSIRRGASALRRQRRHGGVDAAGGMRNARKLQPHFNP